MHGLCNLVYTESHDWWEELLQVLLPRSRVFLAEDMRWFRTCSRSDNDTEYFRASSLMRDHQELYLEDLAPKT